MKKTIYKPGKKAITFNEGGMHRTTGTPAGKPIPAAKVKAAAAGGLGPLARKQALFKKNILTGPKSR